MSRRKYCFHILRSKEMPNETFISIEISKVFTFEPLKFIMNINYTKQECISVGWVPPACWSSAYGALPIGGSACPWYCGKADPSPVDRQTRVKTLPSSNFVCLIFFFYFLRQPVFHNIPPVVWSVVHPPRTCGNCHRPRPRCHRSLCCLQHGKRYPRY